MKIADCRIGFVGFGHMAETICQAIAKAKFIPLSQISFIRRDPIKARINEKTLGITHTSLDRMVKSSDLLILAVRPSQIKPLLQELASLDFQSKMILSLLAGVPLSYYQKYLKGKAELIRALPNIASAVLEGMTVLSAPQGTSREFLSLTTLLFSCMGEVVEIPENLMDIACGIAGSGPGFVFRLIEAAARLGEKEGLSYETSLKMAAQTFAGAARLILKGESPTALIQKIATPQGTTEAGFKKMAENQIEKHLQDVILSSASRSKEMSLE